MSNIVASEDPAMVLNIGKQKQTNTQWYVGSYGQKGPSVVDPPLYGSSTSPDFKGCFYFERESEGSNKYALKNYTSDKYARPQSDPADGDVSVVEGDGSFLWTIISADDELKGSLISLTSIKDGKTYYWGLSADCEDISDIKLRTDSTDLDNHWHFWKP